MVSTLLTRLPAWLVATLAVGLLAGAAQASAATQPIEGTWTFGGGQVNVQATGTDTYTGTVVAATKFVDNDCSHPAGEQIWTISGSGDSYTGFHEWLNPPSQHATRDCTSAGLGEAEWTITPGATENTMMFCTAAPHDGPPMDTNTATNRCYTLSQTVTPTTAPAVPADTTAPAISGTPAVGNTLGCSTGIWSNSPTGYSYEWARDGNVISSATTSSYTVQTADEGDALTCQVTAYNLGGSGEPATSSSVKVPLGTGTSGGSGGTGGGSGGTPGGKARTGCPTATGRISGKRLGNVRLGMTKTQVRHAYRKSHDRRTKFRDVFCLTPVGVTVGYVTKGVDKTLSPKAARKLKGRIVWVITSNTHYSVHGIRVGMSLAKARKHTRLRHGLNVHHATWFVLRGKTATTLVKVKHGKVREVGIADRFFAPAGSSAGPKLRKAGRTQQALVKSLP